MKPIYDLAYHHKKLTPHEHSDVCKPQPGEKDPQQFLKCLRAELDQIRADIK